MLRFVKTHIEVLGAVSVPTKGRRTLPKEEGRLEAAKTVCHWLAVLPVGAALRTKYARVFGISKAAYGWVAKAPTAAQTKRVAAGMARAAKRAMGGSRELKDVMEGGTTNLGVVTACRAMAMVCRRLQKARQQQQQRQQRQQRQQQEEEEEMRWRGKKGTLEARCRHWMRWTGWKEVHRWQWHHDQLQATVKLASQDKRVVMHWLRESWRFRRFSQFLKAKRRDSVALAAGGATYITEQVQKARKNMIENAALFAVATGAFKSPQYWQVARPGVYPHRCPFCGLEEGANHDHLFWSCEGNRFGERAPTNVLQKRLGWPVGEKAFDEAVWKHMACTVLEVWAHRFPRSPPKGWTPRQPKEEGTSGG